MKWSSIFMRRFRAKVWLKKLMLVLQEDHSKKSAPKQYYSHSPLSVASMDGNIRMIEDLLKRKSIDVNTLDREGLGAVHWATINGKYRTVKCLLAHDGFVDMPDSKGRTALQWASDLGRYDIAKHLLERGANINHRDEDGWTALHHAYFYGKTLIITLLFEHGAQTDVSDKNGHTALHWATSESQYIVGQIMTIGERKSRVQAQSMSLDNELCVICVEDNLVEENHETSSYCRACLRKFHKPCLQSWVDTNHISCPNCRSETFTYLLEV